MTFDGFLVLPYGSVVRLADVIGFDWNPPPGDDLELPNGYVHYRNGESKSLLPGDAWALREYFSSADASLILNSPVGYAHQLDRIERRKQAEKAAREKELEEQQKKQAEKAVKKP